jgi:hypothetical protein
MDFFRGTHPPLGQDASGQLHQVRPMRCHGNFSSWPVATEAPVENAPSKKTFFFTLQMCSTSCSIWTYNQTHTIHTTYTTKIYARSRTYTTHNTCLQDIHEDTSFVSERPLRIPVQNFGGKTSHETPTKSKTQTLVGKKPATGSCHPHYVRSSLTKKTWSYILFN